MVRQIGPFIRRLRLYRVLLLAVSGAVLAASHASAQTSRSLPPQVEPGHLERRFKVPAQPRARPETSRPVVEMPISAAEADRIRFVLKGVEIGGLRSYKPAQLAPLYGGLIGQEVSLLQLYGVAAEIAARYQRDDGGSVRIVLPPLRPADGVARFRIIGDPEPHGGG